DFPDHGTVVSATESVLSDHRSLPGSATTPIWLARHRRRHRLSWADHRCSLRNPNLAIGSMEPVARGEGHARQPVLRVLLEQRCPGGLCRHRRRIDRLAASLPCQPPPDYAEYRLPASRLCRLCASRTGGSTGGSCPLY